MPSAEAGQYESGYCEEGGCGDVVVDDDDDDDDEEEELPGG